MTPALSVRAIARTLAETFHADQAMNAAFAELFGTAPAVFLDSPGARDWEDLYPFLVVFPANETFGLSSRTLAVSVLLCVRALGDEPGSAKPSPNAAGVYEMPGADALQRAADALVETVRNSAPGAVLEEWNAEWDFGSEWPEQSALLSFSFRNDFSF